MTIRQLYEQVCEKKSIHIKLEELENQKQQLEQKITMLKNSYDKEQRDVDKLENGSLSSMFYNLTGKLDEKLDKETREMLEAKAKYDTAVFQFYNVNGDISKYQARLAALGDCEQRYNSALQQKLEQMKNDNPRIIELEQQLSRSDRSRKEIEEAISVGDQALRQAVKVKQELDSADSWATFDMFGGGLIADAVKYSHLDTAQQLINELQLQLGRFKTELADVDITAEININVDDFLRAADYLFDNFFTDYAVMDKIEKAQAQLGDTADRISKVVVNLEQLLQQEEMNSQKLKRDLAQIATEAE